MQICMAITFVLLNILLLSTQSTDTASATLFRFDQGLPSLRPKRSAVFEDTTLVELVNEINETQKSDHLTSNFEQFKGNLISTLTQVLDVMSEFEAIRERSNKLHGRIVDLHNFALKTLNSSSLATDFAEFCVPLLNQNEIASRTMTSAQVSEEQAVEGRIQSPRHPYAYPHNLNRTWEIIAPVGHKIRIILELLNLELPHPSTGVCNDFLEIREANSGQLLLKRCGRNYLPADIVSTSNNLTVRLVTDSSEAPFGRFSQFYESYAQEQPDLVPKINFFAVEEFKSSTSVRANITDNVCHNLPNVVRTNVHSVATGNRCIKLYMGFDCLGRYSRLYPGGIISRSKLTDPLRGNARSHSSCIYDEPDSELYQ